MKICLLFFFGIALSLLTFAQTDVSLVNPDFEIPDDSAKYNCNDTAFTLIDGFGWRTDNCNDVGREATADVPGKTNNVGTYDGLGIAFSHNLAGHVYQVVEAVSAAGATYNLSCQTIYSFSDAETGYSCVYISLFSGTDTTNRTIAKGDSLEYIIADVQSDPDSYILWEKVSTSYTTTAGDVGKTLCIEFGNWAAAGSSWTYFYHDAFELKKSGGSGIYNVNMVLTEIYPNPSSGIVYIKSNTGSYITYEICNVLGTVVESGTLKGTSQLDLSNMHKGIYFISVTSGSNTEIHRFVLR